MNLEKKDWETLDRLRARFLDGSAGQVDYWQNERDLHSYDQTFAQRIGWKWDYVLEEVTRRGWVPPGGPALDWACGSGIAGRTFLRHYSTQSIAPLLVADRSRLAVEFAERVARERIPAVPVERWEEAHPFETLLLSHVLTELNPEQIEGLVQLAERATAVVWVEPGTYQAGRALSELRERLRSMFNVVAPCTHQNRCGMLVPENAGHWCHHFASAPRPVFQDGDWSRFGAMAGIDLRSLPLSFLVLDKRPLASLPPGTGRVIGRPRVYKGYALLLGCDADKLCDRRLTQRRLPEAFREVKKAKLDPLQVWQCEGEEVVGIEAVGRGPLTVGGGAITVNGQRSTVY